MHASSGLSGGARSARIMVNTKTMSDVLQYFRHYSRKLEAKARSASSVASAA